MADPSSSSVGFAWLIKTYGLKLIGGVIAAGLILAVLPPKTFKESVLRFSVTIMCSMLFGDIAVATLMHEWPWLLSPGEAARMPVYVLVGAPAYLILGLIARVADGGMRNPLKFLSIVRGGK